MRPFPTRWWAGGTIFVIVLSFILSIFDLGLNSLDWSKETLINALLAGTWAIIMLVAIIFSKDTNAGEIKVLLTIIIWIVLYGLTAISTKPVSLLLHVLGLIFVILALRAVRAKNGWNG